MSGSDFKRGRVGEEPSSEQIIQNVISRLSDFHTSLKGRGWKRRVLQPPRARRFENLYQQC